MSTPALDRADARLYPLLPDQPETRMDFTRLVAALTAALDLADSVTQQDELGHREWGDVPGWKVREVITDALTPKENDS